MVATSMDQLVSLCKRRGFIFQNADIYGGMQGIYDYGPLGVELKNNLKPVENKNNEIKKEEKNIPKIPVVNQQQQSFNNMLNNSIRGIAGNTIFFPLILFSLINLDMAIGNPREHNVINRLNVGNIRE